MNPKDVLIAELKQLIRAAVEDEEYSRMQGAGGIHDDTLKHMRAAIDEESPE